MEKSKRVITLFLIIILPIFLISTSCRKNKDGVNQAQADFEITKALREEFHEENVSIEIHIETKDSRVTLTGTARSNEEKEKAVRLAENTKVVVEGKEYQVKEVDASRLEIREQ